MQFKLKFYNQFYEIKNKIENLSLHQYRLIGDLSAFPKKIKKKYDFVLQKFFTNLWEDHFS
jgi:hypothetical protein